MEEPILPPPPPKKDVSAQADGFLLPPPPKKKEPSQPVSQDGSEPLQVGSTGGPTVSGAERDATIRELTAKAVGGDVVAKRGLERLQAQTQPSGQYASFMGNAFPAGAPVVPSGGDITGKFTQEEVETGVVGAPKSNLDVARMRNIANFGDDKKREAARSSFEQSRKANFVTAEPEKISESRKIMTYLDGELVGVSDEKAVENKQSTFERIGDLSLMNQQMKVLDKEYLDFLGRSNDPAYNETVNKYVALTKDLEDGKELNTSQQRFLRDLRNNAIGAYNSALAQDAADIQLSTDIPTYTRQSEQIAARLKQLEADYNALGVTDNMPESKRQKANAIVQQSNALVQTLDKLRQNTGVTQEAEDALYSISNKFLDPEMVDLVNRYPSLDAMEKENRQLMEERAAAALTNGVLPRTEFTRSFVGSVGNVVFGILQAPKVLGNLLGDDDYDWWDKMYDSSDAILEDRKGFFGRVDKDLWDQMPMTYKASVIGGEAIGSVAAFAAGGAAGNIVKIPARMSTFGVAFLANEGQAYEEALRQGLSPQDAAAHATAFSVVEGAIESAIPDIKYFEPNAKSIFRSTYFNAVSRGLGRKEAMREAVGTLPQSIRSVGEGLLRSGTKEGVVEEGGAQLGNDLTKLAFNQFAGTNYDVFDPEQYVESIVGGFLAGGGISVFQRTTKRSPVQEDVLLTVAEKPETFAFEPLDQKEKTEEKAVIDEASEILEGLRGAPSFEALPREKQAHILSELQRKKMLEKGMRASGVKPESTLAEIEAIENEVKTILDTGKTLTELSEERNKAMAEPEQLAETVELSVEPMASEIKAEDQISTETETDSKTPTEVVGESGVTGAEVVGENVEGDLVTQPEAEVTEQEEAETVEPDAKPIEIEGVAPQDAETPFAETKQPQTFYHGTPQGYIEEFDEEKIGSTTDEGFVGDFGKGFYFGTSPEAAETYAEGEKGNVVSVKLDMKNPLDFTRLNAYKNRLAEEMKARKITALSPKFDELSNEIKEEVGVTEDEVEYMSDVLDSMNDNWSENEFRDELKARGYDSIIAPNGERVVFDKSQIQIIGQTQPKTEQKAAQDETQKGGDTTTDGGVQPTPTMGEAGVEGGGVQPAVDVEGGQGEVEVKKNQPPKGEPVFNQEIDGNFKPSENLLFNQGGYDNLQTQIGVSSDIKNEYVSSKGAGTARGKRKTLSTPLTDALRKIGRVFEGDKVDMRHMSKQEIIDFAEGLDEMQAKNDKMGGMMATITKTEAFGKNPKEFTGRLIGQGSFGARIVTDNGSIIEGKKFVTFMPERSQKPPVQETRTEEKREQAPQVTPQVTPQVESKEGEKIDTKAERVEGVDTKKKPSLKERAAKAREQAEAIRKATEGTAMVAPKLAAAALDVYADILDTADSFLEALEKWRGTKEYKALVDEDRAEVEKAAAEIAGDDYVPPVPPKGEKVEKAEPKKRFRGTIEAFVERSDLDEETKQALRDDPRSYMEQMGIEEAQALGKAVIDELGGIENAIEDVSRPNTQIPLELQSIIFGEGLLFAKEQGKKAKTQEEKDKWADYEQEVHQRMGEKATSAGRYNAFLAAVYFMSPYAAVRAAKKAADEHNRVFAKNAKRQAKEVNEILNDPNDVADAAQEAVEKAMEASLAEKERQIKALEEKIKKLQSEPKKKTPTTKPRVFTKDKLDELRKKAAKLSANPFLDPDQWNYLTYAAGYYLENGYYKFSDFYKKMLKETKGKYEENFADLYENAKQKLIEEGVDPNEFDSEEIVERLAEEMYNNGQALREEIEEKKKEKDLEQKIKAFGRELSERITENLPTQSKEERLRRLAEEIDQATNSDDFSKRVDEYVGLTKEEAKRAMQERIIARFAKMMSEPIPLGKKPDETKEQKMRKMAKELDDMTGTNAFTQQADLYFKIEEEEAAKQKRLQDINRKVKEFDSIINESRSKKTNEDKRKWDQKIIDKAKELDEIHSTDSFSKSAKEFIDSKNNKIRNEAQKRKQESDIKSFFASLSDEIKAPSSDKKTREERLRAKAAELDKSTGSSVFTDQVEQYLQIQGAIEEENKRQREAERKVKDFNEIINESRSKKTSQDKKKWDEKLREKAVELDKIYPNGGFLSAAEAFISAKNDERRIAAEKRRQDAEVRAFFRSLSEAAKKPKQEKKSKIDRLREKAAELDRRFGTDMYSKQLSEYEVSAKSVPDLIKQGLIDAGYGKEVDGKTQVDWRKVTGTERTAAPIIAKVKEALQGKMPQAELDAIMPILEKEMDRLIGEKKAAAVAAKIKQIGRYKRTKLLNNVKRRTRIQSLVETWKQGGLTEKEILEKLADDFGIIAFTKENEADIEKLVEDVDKAKTGAERERAEERLQAYLEWHGHPNFLPRAFHEKMKSALLTGFVTQLKNATGALDAMIKVSFEAAAAQFARGMNKKPTPDSKIFSVIWKSHRKAFATAFDVFWRGGVDMGAAMSEITGNKEGSPSVRFMENQRSDFKEDLTKLDKVGRASNAVVRQFIRAMSAMDTFQQIMAQETRSYTYIKEKLLKDNPEMSSAEAARRAYEIAYSVEIADAQKQAMEEFNDRGITISGVEGWTRFNRRVFEIVEQARGKETMREAQLHGNLITYKATDPGLYSGAAVLLNELLKMLKNPTVIAKMKKSDNPYEVRLADAYGLIMTQAIDYAIPFVKTVGNIVEKGMELYPPYGYKKAIAATGLAMVAPGLKGITMRRAAEYYVRATMGLAILAILNYLADDDEEEGLKKMYGEGSDNIQEKMNVQKARPQNTIVIGGKAVAMEWFGPIQFGLRKEANKLDDYRYDREAPGAIAAFLNTVDGLYFEQTKRVIDIFKKGDEDKIAAKAKRDGAEYLTRAIIPAVQSVRQFSQIISPEVQKAITFPEQLLKFSGMQGLIGRPAYDYRGKAYDMGEVFSSSADGFKRLFTDKIKVDYVDSFVFKYHPGVMTLRKSDKRILGYDDTDGQLVALSDEQFYKVGLDAATRFDMLLTPWVYEFSDKMIKGDKDGMDEMLSSKPKITDALVDKKRVEAFNEMGSGYSEKQYLEAAYKKAVEELMPSGIKESISEIARLANSAAIEQYYIDNNLWVPFSLRGSVKKYDNALKNNALK